MASSPNIRISRKDRETYRRLVKNTRAKLRRVEKKYGIDLSHEINIPKLEHFQTRESFNKWKAEQKSFTNRANLKYQFVQNEHGVVISKKRLHHIKQDTRRAKNIADRDRKKFGEMEFKASGQVHGKVEDRLNMMARPKIGSFGDIKDFDFSKVRTERDIEYREELLARRSSLEYYKEKREQMKENWLQLIREYYGSESDELVEMVEPLSEDEFFKLFISHDEMDFKYHYDIPGVEIDRGDIVGLLTDYLRNYDVGSQDLDIF